MTRDTDRAVRRRTLLRAGAAAGLAAGASGTAVAQGSGYGDWFTGSAKGGAVDNYDGTTADMTGQSEVTVTVGADGNGGTFAFDPPAVRVDPGTTVTFDWVSDTHNVVVEDQPTDADWGGHEPIENTGFSFTSTFETEGVYKYYCDPHLSLGMKGAIVVGDVEVGGGGGGGGGGDGAAGDGTGDIVLPGGEFGQVFLLFLYGVGGAAALLVLAVDAYSRSRSAAAETEEPEPFTGTTAEAAETEPVEELGHDEFDPVGTAALVVFYFLVLVLMWVIMYFVEFLGNGPTVVG